MMETEDSSEDKKPKNTRVFQYWIGSPLSGIEAVREQLWLAHLYRNQLVEIERGRRNAVRSAIEDDECERLKEIATKADEACIAAANAIKDERVKTGSKTVPTGDLLMMRARRKHTIKKLNDARKSRREELSVRTEISRINEMAKALCRNARKYCNVYPGTYQLQEAAAKQSFSATNSLWVRPPKPHERLRDGIGILPNNPRFVRWKGEGSLSVQFASPGGREIAAVLGKSDTQLRIVPADHRWPQIKHSRSGKLLPAPKPKQLAKRHVLSIRVDSIKAKPVWADFPLMLDRPLPGMPPPVPSSPPVPPIPPSVATPVPEKAFLARATVHVFHEGPKEKWLFDVQVNEPARKPTHGIGMVAIDVGWRRIGDEIRVAAWGDDAGNFGEIRLSSKDLNQLHQAEALRSVRDKNFDIARDALLSWLDRSATDGSFIPNWLIEKTTSLPRWRSQRRLAVLTLRWRSKRFPGDDEIFQSLEAWRKQDKHLWSFEAGQRSGAIARRDDWFRCWADYFAKTYDIVIFENFDKRKVALKPDITETESERSERARSNRHLAAVSHLCGAAKSAVMRRGGTFVLENPAHSTHDCAIVNLAHGILCGERNVFDQASELTVTCAACGVTWDRDLNACMNLIHRYKTSASRPVEANLSEVARNDKNVNPNIRKGEGGWDRVRRLKAEKKTAEEISRRREEDAAE